MQKKKIPLRKCTGCGEMKPKTELVRIVKTPGEKDDTGAVIAAGEILLDLTGKKSGRGAYVCKSVDCLKAARKVRRFERAFSCQIPPQVFERLEEEIGQYAE